MGRRRRSRRAQEGLWFGVALMLFGGVFLLNRAGFLGMDWISVWWPLFPIGFGVARVLTWQSAESVSSGVVWTLMGLWFMASTEGWYGLSWHNSWPLALAAIGTGMVVKSLLIPVFDDEEDPEESKGDRDDT